jgi:hypothetical protein
MAPTKRKVQRGEKEENKHKTGEKREKIQKDAF